MGGREVGLGSLLNEISPLFLAVITLHPFFIKLGELVVWFLCEFREGLHGMLVDLIVKSVMCEGDAMT